MSVDENLRRMPQSTTAWSCPWFESFAVCCMASIVLGYASAMTLGAVTGTVAAILLLWQVTERRRGSGSC